MRARTIAALALVLLVSPAAEREGGTFRGPAHVIDGDTLVIGPTTVRLKGVDAAERRTLRGEQARLAMIEIVNSVLKLGRAFPRATIAVAEDGNVCLTLPDGKPFRIVGPFDTDYGWRLLRKRIAQMIARTG